MSVCRTALAKQGLCNIQLPGAAPDMLPTTTVLLRHVAAACWAAKPYSQYLSKQLWLNNQTCARSTQRWHPVRFCQASAAARTPRPKKTQLAVPLEVAPSTSDSSLAPAAAPQVPVSKLTHGPEGSLLLVDASYILHKTYHSGAPALQTTSGLNTSVIHGFLSSLLTLLQLKPTHVAVVFDAGGGNPTRSGLEPSVSESVKNFRYSIYKDYKANRPKSPTSVNEAGPYVRDILSAMDICCLEYPGIEADDIIGSLTTIAKPNYHVYIASSDSDFYQLLDDDNVTVLKTMKGRYSGRHTSYCRDDFLAEFDGLRPEQHVDMKALAGDPADNIKGVAGVGRITALRLIKEFGSLDSLLARLDEVSAKGVREKLTAGRDEALRSREVLKLHMTLPPSMLPEFEDLRLKVPRHRSAALSKLEEFELVRVSKTFESLWTALKLAPVL
eukprot:jgi/Chlat1/4024/Chrsp26S03995